MSSST
jgi:hypothetical protein